jgi:Protein of unknown function (DUF3300)
MRFATSRVLRASILALALQPLLTVAQQAAVPPTQAAPPPATQEPSRTFSKEQLDQMMAPIALYPDSLLSQILMASTYPADVADAAKWSKANPNQKGDDAVKAVENEPWDPSVKSLVAFPQVLDTMGGKPDWVQNLGDAFLASSKDVLDSAQRLRAQAQKAGNLKSNEQQTVTVAPDPQTQQTVIQIEPANPQTVYVPAYNPTVVYGTWPYPAYPPYYYPPSPYYYPGAALATGIAFGIGVAAVNSLWGGCNWGHGDVNVNVNKYNNVNVNNKLSSNQTSFKHNSDNRRGVPYGDSKSRQQYGKNVAGDATQRASYRGQDTGRDAQRAQAQKNMESRGMAPANSRGGAGGPGGAGGNAGARPSTGAVGGGNTAGRGGGGAPSAGTSQARGNSDSALKGAGNAGQARQQTDRGNASRASMSQSHGGGGGGGGRSGGGGGGGGGGGRGGGGGGRR